MTSILRIIQMRLLTIRPARPDEYDEIARVWMNSWASTGLEDASEPLLAKLRARILVEVGRGWSLYVADDRGTLAAMLALHLPHYLDQLFVSPEYQGQSLGGGCSPSADSIRRTKSRCAACAKTKRRGAGTSARVLFSKRNRSSRRRGVS
jgi:GNAT superfamily N-acetyltransferase